MNKQKSVVVSGKPGRGAQPARERAFRFVESAAFIKACSDLAAQLDAHRFGAAIFLGILTLATDCEVVVALAVVLRPATASRDND